MIPEKIQSIMNKLIDSGFEAYIVGGAVRDMLIGIEPHDYDIFTNATGDEILLVFPRGKIIGGEERQEKILTVIVEGVEISSYRSNGDRTQTGKSLKDHIMTCDFTINALAMDYKEKLIDLVEGEKDVKAGIIRFVGDAEQRILEDPLRIFRGIRFAAKYNFLISDRTPFENFAKYVKNLPKERIRDEFMKILPLYYGLAAMESFNMIEYILPEWKNCKTQDGGQHHNEFVGHHMMLAVTKARELTANPLLLLAIFLHDIGKPMSAGEKNGNITFYDHQFLGADYVRAWMNEYKFSNEEIKYVYTAIKHHMMGKTGEIKDNKFARICNELDEARLTPEDMLTLTYCDNQANLTQPRIWFTDFIRDNGFYQRYYETKYRIGGFNPNCLEITGKEIIKITGQEPGPIIGRIKYLLFEKVARGELINRKDRLIEAIQQFKKDGNPNHVEFPSLLETKK